MAAWKRSTGLGKGGYRERQTCTIAWCDIPRRLEISNAPTRSLVAILSFIKNPETRLLLIVVGFKLILINIKIDEMKNQKNEIVPLSLNEKQKRKENCEY